MLTFSEEVMVLLLHDEDGAFMPVPGASLSFALAGAVLMDLSFARRIDTLPERLVVHDATPTGEPVLDHTLTSLAEHAPERDTRTWVKVLSEGDAARIREQSLQSLVARGMLALRERSFLYVFRPLSRPKAVSKSEREVKLRIGNVLFSDAIPNPRDVALVCLADACDLLSHIFSGRDMGQYRPRIDQLRKMDLISREFAGAITEILRAVMSIRLEGKVFALRVTEPTEFRERTFP